MLEQRHFEMMDDLLTDSAVMTIYNQVQLDLIPSGHPLPQLLIGAERQIYNIEKLIETNSPLEYKDEEGNQQSIPVEQLPEYLDTMLLTYLGLTHQIKYGRVQKPEEPAVEIQPRELSIRTKMYNDIVYANISEDDNTENEAHIDDFSYGLF